MKKIALMAALFVSVPWCDVVLAQTPIPQMGGDFRPSYESYRLDKFILQDELSYSGELGFSIPLLTVPGRHSHNFDISLNYNSNVTQRQFASWVGLGWNLELGCVERSVNGRTDEPSHYTNVNAGVTLGLFHDGGLYRGNMGGRFKPDYTSDEPLNRDIADLYRLSIDNGGMEIIPFPDEKDSVYTTGSTPVCFLPAQYKPWTIGAYCLGEHGTLSQFFLQKEDGTMYSYGGTAGSDVDWAKVMTDPNIVPLNSQQSYGFPYRWNLTQIQYPDGSTTSISYAFHNTRPNEYYRRHENVVIDRSQPNSMDNFFGRINSYHGQQYDYSSYSYSHPTILETDTHYLVFQVSQTADSTDRNCRLDRLILYDKATNTELKRVLFHYAEDPNPNTAWIAGNTNLSAPAWQENERLNNGQLTLVRVTVTSGENVDLEENSADAQQYNFTYTTNPKIDIESISTAVSTGYPDWPGYFTAPSLNDAWRIKTITLPTGGKYTYEYEPEDVSYDPEGGAWFDSWDAGGGDGNYYSFQAQPRSRLKTKTFEDVPGGTVRRSTYSYSNEVIYDPPSGVYQSTYVPHIYRNTFGYDPGKIYILFRNCGVGHRWVQVNNPDQTWKRVYYTSSYRRADAKPGESQSDYITSNLPGTLGNLIVSSRAGCRGLVWTDSSGACNKAATTGTMYYYSYIQQGGLRDRYDYYGMLGNRAGSQYVLRTSIWARLDSTVTTVDGVTSLTAYQYYPTMRESAAGNGLVSVKSEKGSSSDRQTQFVYAYTKYPDMGPASSSMLSQMYSKSVRNATSNVDVSKDFTIWDQFGGHWLPWGTYVWNGSPTDITAPADLGGNVMRQRTLNYDNLGYSDILSVTDANNNVTTYYYSNDTNDPFRNDPAGLSRGYVTGVLEPIPSPALRKSYRYDHFGNVTLETDENGKTTEARYDKLGRIKSVIDPLGRQTQQFSYYMPGQISAGDLNSITETAFRSVSDYTVSKAFFDAAGYEREKLTVYADSDIISPTTYDGMWRVNRIYKTYRVSRGAYSHLYDQNFDFNDAAYYGYGYPYAQNDYYPDGAGRLKDARPPGSTYQTNHFTHYAYGTNSGADNTDFPEAALYKTTVYDENNDYANPLAYQSKRLEFKDKFGNLVQSVTDSAGLKLTTKYIYDVNGNLLQAIPPGGTPYATSYTYDKMGRLTQKTSPDAGTVRYLYDKNGNLRLVQDANHTGAMNSINIPATVTSSTITNGSLPAMTLPGRITLSLSIVSGSGTVSLTVNANGVPVAKVTTSSSTTNTFILPKGTYTYSVSPNGTAVQYSITCTNGFELVYNKYDGLNRLIETGEYQSTSAGNFSQANAYEAGFPANNVVRNRAFIYDRSNGDPYVTGQRNLCGRLSVSVSYRLGEVALTTFYSYDENGRVEWIVQKELGKKILYDYDFQGDVTKKSYQDLNNPANNFFTWYEYDQLGRLARVFSGSDFASRVQEANYTYTASGRVSRLQLGNAQGVDYVYNPRDWLDAINNQNLSGETQLPPDKFGEVIGYDNIDYVGHFLQAAPQYNGNISWLMYNMSGVPFDGLAGTTPLVGYVYSYDNANRLLGANFGYYANGMWNPTTRFGENGISYDGDGNIVRLTRYPSGAAVLLQLLTLSTRPGNSTLYYGAVAIIASTSYVVSAGNNDTFEASDRVSLRPGFRANAGSVFRARISSSPHGSDPGPMDQLTYNYLLGSNRLLYVTDDVASDTYTSDLDSQQPNNYAYDGSGNMLQDLGNQIAFVIYDINNLPVTVYKSDNNRTQWQYFYDTDGNRFRKYDGIVYTSYVNGADGNTEALTQSNLPTTTYNLWGSDNVGKVIRGSTGLTRYYYLKDHLGSVRMTVDAAGARQSWNDYYPYGLLMDSRNGVYGDTDPRYKFTSKERDVETQYDYFGARYYDSRIGRWLSVDPMGDEFLGWSPYTYCASDPLNVFDPNGKGYYYKRDGTYLGTDGRDDDYVYAVSDPYNIYHPSTSGLFVLMSDITKLAVGHSDFVALAGTLYAEDAGTWECAAATYDVLENRGQMDNKSTVWEASHKGVYGWAKRGKINSPFASNSQKQNAFRGLLAGMLDNVDYSNGAYYWQGVDFQVQGGPAYNQFYRVGFKFSDPNHDIWGLGNSLSANESWNHKYESTAALSKTTFMRLTDLWRKAQRHKGW